MGMHTRLLRLLMFMSLHGQTAEDDKLTSDWQCTATDADHVQCYRR